MSIEQAEDLEEEEQTNRIVKQWLSNDQNIIEKIQNIQNSSQKLLDVQENERSGLMSPIYDANYFQSQNAIDQMHQTQTELIKQHDTQQQNNKIKDNPILATIIDQEVNNRAITYSLKSPKIDRTESCKLIYDQQKEEAQSLMLQERDEDLENRQQSIQRAIEVLNEELRLYDSEIENEIKHGNSSSNHQRKTAIIMSRKEAKQRLMEKQQNYINDEAQQIRNFEYIKMLTQSWQIGAENLSKQQQMIMNADSKLTKENITEVTYLQQNEQQNRINIKLKNSNSSNNIISIIGYPELNFMTEIEVIERQKQCMEFLLDIAQKCDKAMKLNRNTKLLKIWNKRRDQLAKRKNKSKNKDKSHTSNIKTDWILYADCKNLLNTKKSRLIKQLKQLWHLYRITITNKKTQDVKNKTSVSFIPRKVSSTIYSTNNGRSLSNILTPPLSPTKKPGSSITISANYSTPTFAFQSKIDPEHVRSVVHKKLFKHEKMKIDSKPETHSPSPQKKVISINTNTSPPKSKSKSKIISTELSSTKSNIDISKYVSPINQYLEMQNEAFLKMNDASATSIPVDQIFTVHEERKKTPNKRIFERLSKPKKVHIRKVDTKATKKDAVGTMELKPKSKKKKPRQKDKKTLCDTKVFNKLYEDARIRKTRHQIAKGLSDSARLANIKSKCSFQPKLYKSQAIVHLESDAIPVHQRMKQWEIRREKNLQKLIENDPIRQHCTFQPMIKQCSKPVYDYSHPNQVSMLVRLEDD